MRSAPRASSAPWNGCTWLSVMPGATAAPPQLLIHRPTRTVIARLSTWPERWDDRPARYADVANVAVLERLA